MIGTFINTLGAFAGGVIGMLFGSKIKQRFQDIVLLACGVSTLFVGISGALKQMLVVSDGSLSTQGEMMLVVCMFIGALVGEAMDINGRMENFGTWIKSKVDKSSDSLFIEGFVTTSLATCIGAMAILGPINEVLNGDMSMLLTKAVLDFITVMILAVSYGKGSLFGALPILLVQGVIAALAGVISPVMTPAALSNLSLVGNALITCIGINLIFDRKIKVANMLPAVLFAVIWAFLPI